MNRMASTRISLCGQAALISEHKELCEMRRSIAGILGELVDKRNSIATQQVCMPSFAAVHPGLEYRKPGMQ